MHSKIFQLSDKPISKKDYITEDDIPEYFVEQIADYVDNIPESYYEHLYEVLAEHIHGKAEGNCLQLSEEGIREFFLVRYEKFLEKVQEIGKLTSEDFIKGKFHYPVYELKTLEDDLYDLYIYYNDNMYTVSSFLRNETDENKNFYLGAVIDYHF